MLSARRRDNLIYQLQPTFVERHYTKISVPLMQHVVHPVSAFHYRIYLSYAFRTWTGILTSFVGKRRNC